MTSAANERMNYTTIQENIEYQKEQQAYRSEKIAFEQNFLIPYLDSSSALFFYQHENNILNENEYVIHFTNTDTLPSPLSQRYSRTQDTQIERKNFFHRVIDYINTN